ncbi:hypothetical protein [Streptomyces sp. URMC 124]
MSTSIRPVEGKGSSVTKPPEGRHPAGQSAKAIAVPAPGTETRAP